MRLGITFKRLRSDVVKIAFLTCPDWHADISNNTFVNGLVIGIAPNPFPRYSTSAQFDGGKIFEYMSKLGLNRGVGLQRCHGMVFLASCPWMVIEVFCWRLCTRESVIFLVLMTVETAS